MWLKLITVTARRSMTDDASLQRTVIRRRSGFNARKQSSSIVVLSLAVPHSMRSRVYITVRCPFVLLSVCPSQHGQGSRFDTVRSTATGLW